MHWRIEIADMECQITNEWCFSTVNKKTNSYERICAKKCFIVKMPQWFTRPFLKRLQPYNQWSETKSNQLFLELNSKFYQNSEKKLTNGNITSLLEVTNSMTCHVYSDMLFIFIRHTGGHPKSNLIMKSLHSV